MRLDDAEGELTKLATELREKVAKENLPRIYDGAIQGLGSTSSYIVAAVFGLFIVFSLARPWNPTDAVTEWRDALLIATSLVIAAMIGESYVRLSHYGNLAIVVGKLLNLQDDKDLLDNKIHGLAKNQFRRLSPLVSLEIKMTYNPWIILFLGGIVFVLLWVAALF